jgi:hypothetical protein
VARLRRYGTTRRVTAGEILYSPADRVMASDRIDVTTSTEVVMVDGGDHLESGHYRVSHPPW